MKTQKEKKKEKKRKEWKKFFHQVHFQKSNWGGIICDIVGGGSGIFEREKIAPTPEPTISDMLNIICYISLNTFFLIYCVLGFVI